MAGSLDYLVCLCNARSLSLYASARLHHSMVNARPAEMVLRNLCHFLRVIFLTVDRGELQVSGRITSAAHSWLTWSVHETTAEEENIVRQWNLQKLSNCVCMHVSSH